MIIEPGLTLLKFFDIFSIIELNPIIENKTETEFGNKLGFLGEVCFDVLVYMARLFEVYEGVLVLRG
jgi:hypothetical protein